MVPRPGTNAHIAEIARRLEVEYGPRPWVRRHSPVGELVTTVLSQSTTDANQFRAFDALVARFPTWDAVRAAPADEVVAAIRVGGLANQKGPRIQAILEELAGEPRGADLEWLADVPVPAAVEYLTRLPGVGVKTAACVLCFGFDRHIVPVDTHVHRIALRTRMVPARTDVARTQWRLTRATPVGSAYGVHMRLIAHGRAICVARAPRCERCVLRDLCPEGRRRTR